MEMVDPPGALDMGELGVHLDSRPYRDMDGRVRSYTGRYRNDNVRVIQHTMAAADDSTSSICQNFEIFCDSLIRNAYLPEKITYLEDRGDGCMYFIFKEDGSRLNRVFQGNNSIGIDLFRSLVLELVEATKYAIDLDFGFNKLEAVDISICDEGCERNGNFRYHAKIKGFEKWKYIGEDESKLARSNRYIAQDTDTLHSPINTQRALKRFFDTISEKLNVGAGTTERVALEHLLGEIDTGSMTLDCVKYHPFFWDNYRCIEFLSDISDWLKSSTTTREDFEKLDAESLYDPVHGWHSRVDSTLLIFIKHGARKDQDFSDTSTQTYWIVRGLRNTCEHARESDAVTNTAMTPINIYDKFSTAFPNLLVFTYKFARSNGSGDPFLKVKYHL